jgi:hypothetical protein
MKITRIIDPETGRTIGIRVCILSDGRPKILGKAIVRASENE